MFSISKHVLKFSITKSRKITFLTSFHGKMSVFTMSVNPIIGKKEWVEKPEYYDYHQEVARSSYADMLHDKERNEKYYSAIKKAVQSMKDQGRKAKVLDIGTGTGLLSMMAARSGADSIVACEVFPPVARCAGDVIKENNFQDKIKIVLTHSSDLTVGPDGDLCEKANILVAEVFDTELIGEGALRTFQHALKELLEPDSIVIPSEAYVYIQIVDSPLISSWNRLTSVKVGSDKVISLPEKVMVCPGSTSVHDMQMSQIPEKEFTMLTDPVCVFQFSFTGEKSIEMNEMFIKQVKAIHDGKCEIVFMWWELKMDMHGEVMLNNGPKWVQPDPLAAPWRDHWMQAIYYLPQTMTVQEGDCLTLTAYHDEYSLWFAIPRTNHKALKSPTCSCMVHVADSHARIGMKNDKCRNDDYVLMLEKVITPSSVCLCINDGSLLPLMAAKLGAARVFAIESSHFHYKMVKSYVEANDETSTIKVIAKEPGEVTEEDLEMKKIDVLITEPYFVNCVRPWEMMRFWHLRTLLQPLLAANATVVPGQGKLRAVAVQFDDLWKIRAPVKSAVGFDLTKFDAMVQRAISIADAAVEPHPLWEYPCTALSEPFDVLKLDFSKDTFTDGFDVSGQTSISSSGTCNAVVLWTDYSFEDTTVTNGPVQPIKPGTVIDWYKNCQQGVYFLHPPATVNPGKSVLKFKMDFRISDTTFKFSVSEM